MRIRMQLLSDAIFGNGMSVPGGEDLSVLTDEYGFPYYKGGTFKGVFREALEQYLFWTVPKGEQKQFQIRAGADALLGKEGNDAAENPRQLVFSDFQLSDHVKQCMLAEADTDSAGCQQEILDSLTHLRTFTRLTEDGIAKEGSLRSLRCVNKGLSFYSEVSCSGSDAQLLTEVFSGIRWIGTMRNRGFGKIRITTVE